ncbi:MAG TPA: hypothetical protein VM325_05410 [Alphaproteobacteria bacterium]|nr:hypothetical protein [Alphaproteobacteria bacterium]
MNVHIKWLSLFVGSTFGTLVIFVGAVVGLVDSTAMMTYKRSMVAFKLARLEQAQRQPHVIFVSGSNALYSIDSMSIQQRIGRPVTNAAVHWGLALYMVEEVVKRARSGDIIILPMEYSLYTGPTPSETEACYQIAQARTRLKRLDDWILAIRTCPQRWLGYAIILKIQQATIGGGVFSAVAELNPSGDILINTPSKATPRNYAASPTEPPESATGTGFARLERAIRIGKRKGVRFAVTFPVMPMPSKNARLQIERWEKIIRRWAKKNRIDVLSSSDKHYFPSHCFFDTIYHLHRGCSPQNSEIYASAIMRAIRSGRYP